MGQDNTAPRKINKVEGAVGQVMKSGGPGNVETWGYEDIFDKFRDFISWGSVDGFSKGGDVGFGIVPQGTGIYLLTAATINFDAWIYSERYWASLLDAGKVVTVEFIIVRLISIADQNIWLRLATAIADPPSETVDHFGWKIVGEDLSASSADGAIQEITDTGVNLAAVDQRTRLKMVLTPGTSCKFYVNDVLKATHETRLPLLTDYYLHYHIRTLANAQKIIYLGRVLLEKEHA